MAGRLLTCISVVALSVAAISVVSCTSHASSGEQDTAYSDSLHAVNEMTSSAWEWVDSVMDGMTDEQMVGEVMMPAVFARSSSPDIDAIRRYVSESHVGGFVLLRGDVSSVALIADTLSRLSSHGVFLAIDAENGLRMRLTDAPEFPWNSEVGKRADDQVMYDFGREIARECRALGISMVLGPVMDVVPGSESHGIARRRSFGDDPHRVADLAVAYARGVEDGGVLSVAKHFPGHGSASADSHKGLGVIRGEAARLDSVDLYPFHRYASELLSGVMVGHLAAESLDSLRRPAVVSPVLMQNVLRSRLGFGGLVLTDALNMEGALGVTAWEAIEAGADIVLAPSDTRREIRLALEALNDGRLRRDVLENRVRRILFYKYLTGVGRRERIDVGSAVSVVNEVTPGVADTLAILRNSSFPYPYTNNSRNGQ